jgi:hypothetical protein
LISETFAADTFSNRAVSRMPSLTQRGADASDLDGRYRRPAKAFVVPATAMQASQHTPPNHRPPPDPGFALSSPVRIVRSVCELHDEGSGFKNCTAIGIVWTPGLPRTSRATLAALGRHGGLWTVDEVKGRNNETVSAEDKADLPAALKAAGLRILRCHPTHALSAIENGASIADCEDALRANEVRATIA